MVFRKNTRFSNRESQDNPIPCSSQEGYEKQEVKRPVFALTYDPRLPNIPNIPAKHWRSMVVQDAYLSEVFIQPPLTAFRRQKNLRDHLIRAKVPSDPKPYPQRRQRGMRKCGNNCTACPFIREVKSININRSE